MHNSKNHVYKDKSLKTILGKTKPLNVEYRQQTMYSI